MRATIIAPMMILAIGVDRVRAEDAGAAGGGLGQAATKAVAFELVSSAAETAAFLAFYGGSTIGGPTIFAVSLASAASVYVAHELLWEAALPGAGDGTDPGVIAAKTASYRVGSSLRSFTVGSLLGGADMVTSSAFTLTVAAADSLLDVGNEYFFAKPGPAVAGAEP
ncbi:hypothetical protein CRT60_12460 [Azospirillum palustre]|uniref:DUF2061 domain-containing protein n=1 Tax=Azospirillum palustre TaxID=2044885 RepID=A0A2B8BHA1_9PROT|nr:hypothetical protein [Azospirillum palustre]PGH57265.1 hypothetical protein CRT60_12460 [Azospirillum palustre]